MRTAGFASLDYTAVPTSNALCLYPPDVSRWGTRWYRRDERSPPSVLCFWLRKEVFGATHADLGRKRTISPDVVVQRSFGTAVISSWAFLLGLLGICLVTWMANALFILVFWGGITALATVGVTANVTSTLNMGRTPGIISSWPISPDRSSWSAQIVPKPRRQQTQRSMLRQTSLSDRRNSWRIEPLEF